MLVNQVASTSKASSGPSANRAGTNMANSRTPTPPMAAPAPLPLQSPPTEVREADGAAEVFAVREGAALPPGFSFVIRSHSAPPPRTIASVLVDLTTPPKTPAAVAGEDAKTEKRKVAEKRNATRSTNKKVNANFVKELKDSLAEGRPPEMKVPESQTHLKARWHAAAKEACYKILDLRREGWKGYSHFEKTKMHNEMNAIAKFEPPIERRRVEKFLAQHLRGSRAVWKAHWRRHGDKNRHPNCPEEAWAQLIKWWCTEACTDEANDMASRRSMVQNNSKLGRKELVDQMEEEVRMSVCFTLFYVLPWFNIAIV
jgi:hypothetical protein